MNNWSTWERPKFRVYQTVKLPFIVSLHLMRVSAMFESVCGWSELPLSFRTTVRRVVHAASTPLTHKTSRDCCQLVPMFVIFTLACHQRLIISATRPHCHRPTDTTLRNLCLPLETSDRIFAASADFKNFKNFQSAADRRQMSDFSRNCWSWEPTGGCCWNVGQERPPLGSNYQLAVNYLVSLVVSGPSRWLVVSSASELAPSNRKIQWTFDRMLTKWPQTCFGRKMAGLGFWLEFPERMWVKSVGPADDLADSGVRLLTLTRS